MLRKTLCHLASFIIAVTAGTAAAGVNPGQEAPLIELVDENMRVLDMADLVGDAPLLFLYGSAT